MLILNNYLNQKNLACIVLVVMMANLIIGGILLPQRQAQAVIATIANQIVDNILQAAKWVWEKAVAAAEAIKSAITSAVAAWQKADSILMKALKFAWDVLRKQLMAMLVNDIVKWIQGGGQPLGVTDWQQLLKNAANNAAGEFINKYLGMGFLCQRFDLKIKIALTAIPTFQTSVSCTFSQIVANINTFLNDFSQGGWKAWISLSEAPNNLMGAYLIAMDKKIGVEAEGAQAAQNEGVASSGFLGEKRCIEIDGVPTGTPVDLSVITPPNKCTKQMIVTPGQSVAEAAFKGSNLDIDWLIQADELQEYFAAIINAVINRVIREGLFLLQPSSPGGTAGGIPSSSALTSSITGSQTAKSLTQQLQLVASNLNAYIGHLQAGSGTTGTIQARLQNLYAGNLKLFINMLQLGCTIPSEVTPTQAIISSVTVSDCATTCPCTSTITEVIRDTAVAVGSVDSQRTTVQVQGEPDSFGGCVMVSHPSACFLPVGVFMATCSLNVTTNQTLSRTVATSAFLAAPSTANPLTAAQNKINLINSAIPLIQTYEQESNNYLTLSQATTTTQAQLNAADASLTAAEAQAVAALQAITGSSATDLMTLMSDVQNYAVQIAQDDATIQAQNMQALQTPTCPATPNTIEYDLCVAQGTRYYLASYCDLCFGGSTLVWGGGSVYTGSPLTLPGGVCAP